MKLVALGLISVGVLGAAACGSLSVLNNNPPVAAPLSVSVASPSPVTTTQANGSIHQKESAVATTAQSSNVDLLLQQAVTEYANKNYKHSLKLFQRLVEKDSTNARGWRNVGEAYHATGDNHNAALAMKNSRELYLQNGDENGASQVAMQLEDWKN